MATVTELKSDFNPDNERLDKFLDLYIELDGDAQRAWVEAGYSESGKGAAMAKIRKHWDVVERRIVEKIGRHVPEALAVVYHLMQNAKNESIRLKAAQDLLGRAGYDQAHKIEIGEKSVEDMSQKEIARELDELLSRHREGA